MFLAQNYTEHQCSHRSCFRGTTLSDTLDVLSYEIHLNEVNFESKQLKADAKLRIKAKVQLADKIQLELKSLNVTAITVNDEEVNGFSQFADRISIPLTSALEVDDEVDVHVWYEGTPFSEAWGGFHLSSSYAFNLGVGFTSDPHNLGKSWFPCVDDFKDRAMYEVYVTVPEDQVGISGGSLETVETLEDGRKTYHWKMEHSIPTYLASIAIGNYDLFEDEFNGQEAQIPITIYTKPSQTSGVEGSFQHLKDICSEYEAWFGDYPWERIGYVGTTLGAMEHPTNIAYPDFAINGNTHYESLFSHELSHMWFGDLVTCASAKDMWMNEGWAVFCEMLFREQIYGKENFLESFRDKQHSMLNSAHISDGGFYALYGIPTEITYGKTVYDKGGTVVQALRVYLGDEKFFSAVKSYLQHFAFQYADTWQLRDYLSEASGVDLTDFFDTWVFQPGTPCYRIDSFDCQPADEGGFKTDVYMNYTHRASDHIGNSHIIPVTFVGSNWELYHDTLAFDGAEGHSVRTLDFEPKAVLIDYDNEMGDGTINQSLVVKETGELNLNNLAVRLITEMVPENDSALVQINHHYAKPTGDTKEEDAIKKISNNHYYSIDGLFKEGFKARARFKLEYGASNCDLNDDLLEAKEDSIVLLYRADRSQEWTIDDHYTNHTVSMKNFYTKDLKKGEYTFGLIDKSSVGLDFISAKHDSFQIYPNPAKSIVELIFPERSKGKIYIFDSHGKERECIQKNDKRKKMVVKLKDYDSGVYIIRFVPEDSGKDYVERLIIE